MAYYSYLHKNTIMIKLTSQHPLSITAGTPMRSPALAGLLPPESLAFERERLCQARLVGSGEADATRADERRPLIGTSFLLSCAGIAVYDPSARVAGATHIFVTPAKVERFAALEPALEAVIAAADALGGRVYAMHAFNVRYGCRPKENNLALEGMLSEAVRRMMREGRVLTMHNHDQRRFLVDSRDGQIYV